MAELLGGPYFSVAGAGESHGPGIVTIVCGCPPGQRLTREEIQVQLDRRRPGSTKHGTPRREGDRVVLLSGLYQDDHQQLTAGPIVATGTAETDNRSQTATYETGYATGEPISALVLSTSNRSDHYTQFQGPEGEVRPGHTDLVKYHQSRGFVDIRGGGRSSYRSTISDVIGGTIARRVLADHFSTVFVSAVTQVGPLRAQATLSDAVRDLGPHVPESVIESLLAAINANWETSGIPALGDTFATAAGELIKETRIAGDSLGAVVEVVALNVPALAGDPLYNSLKMRLMGSLGGLHAAQACEIGDGVAVAGRTGSENNDPIRTAGYRGNSHGGLLGGITTGNPLVARVSFKPTSSVVRPQESVRKNLEEIDFTLRKGRHDPCVGIRAGVTLESRMAIELLNAVLSHATRRIDPSDHTLFSE
ncbi:MAG: chorismate synthase [Chloroflexota bacterium]